MEDKNQRISIIPARLHPTKGVVLVMPGLNLRPSKMSSIVQILHEAGYDVVRGSLSGHFGDEREFQTVTRDLWLIDMGRAYRDARSRADLQKLPLHFVGFSLGALINLDLMNAEEENPIRYDRMILLAPAVALHRRSYLIKAFGIFGPGFFVPTFANREYRANPRGTPVAAYRALFESIKRIQATGIKEREIPTLLFVDPKDEMVDQVGLETFIKKNHLSKWKLVKISSSQAPWRLRKGRFHHLIIDEWSLGPSRWKVLKANILNHLETKEGHSA